MTGEGDMGLTWEARLALWLPRPPLFGAVLVAAFLIASYLGFSWFFDLTVHRLPILILLMIAYTLMVPRFFALRFALDWKQFGFEIPVSGRRETEAWVLSCPRERIRRSRVAGVVGVVSLFGLNTWIAYLEGADPLTVWLRLHSGTFNLAACMSIGWLMGRAIYLSSTSHTVLPRPSPSEIDLLHLENLYAIGRSGLRVALIWLVGMSIGSLFFLDSILGMWGVLPLFLLGLVIGLVVFLRPARSVRRLIRDAKREELARLEPLLRQARENALADDNSTQGRLTDLLTYQDRVRSTPEWSFDSSTLWRFGLYLLIPVGSMVGGALVERFVNALLD